MISIGADPEVLLKNKQGEYVAACGLYPGSKESPHDMDDDWSIQVDNVSLEFNIKPAHTLGHWVDRLDKVKKGLSELTAQSDLVPVYESSAIYDMDKLDHPGAWVFGCEPDFNAWDMATNANPTHENECFRSAGGHVHLGFTRGMTNQQAIRACLLMDMVYALHFVKHENENDKARRAFYGRAGSMRFKPYGMEYRTASTVWLRNSELTKQMYAFAYQVVLVMQNDYMNNNLTDIQSLMEHEELITTCINQHKKVDLEYISSLLRHLGIKGC